jgi:hypothetical protein
MAKKKSLYTMDINRYRNTNRISRNNEVILL